MCLMVGTDQCCWQERRLPAARACQGASRRFQPALMVPTWAHMQAFLAAPVAHEVTQGITTPLLRPTV